MIESTCPRCGAIHKAPTPVTHFGCCPVDSTPIVDRSLLQVIRHEARPTRSRLDRPGDAVYHLIKKHFGIDPPNGCGCRRVQANMNANGWKKCLAEIDSLADELAGNAEQFSWGVTFWAATQATMTGALRWLNPFDPWRSIIREACRLTKGAIDGQEKNSEQPRPGGVP